MEQNKLIYAYYHIPLSYLGKTYEDTSLSKLKQQDVYDKISRAPTKGVLVVRGTAAPVINQLVEQNRIITGIDFVARSQAAFEIHVNPKADVILIHGLGSEISVNHNVSRQVLQNLLAYYVKSKTLVVIETQLTKSDLRNNYDFIPTNFLTIGEPPEESWV